MRDIWRITAWGLVGTALLAAPVAAGDREKRAGHERAKPTLTTSERIEQWLHVLRTDRKDDRREKAVEELGKLASPEYPEIVSALIDALVRDSSASVRKAVVKTIADVEPATHEIKDALEQTVKQDKSWLVRQAARFAAWRYKPQDEPPNVPGPRMRNVSKPGGNGVLTSNPRQKLKPVPPADPLKNSQPPTPVLPVVPAEQPPAPPIAPRPSGARLGLPRGE